MPKIKQYKLIFIILVNALLVHSLIAVATRTYVCIEYDV